MKLLLPLLFVTLTTSNVFAIDGGSTLRSPPQEIDQDEDAPPDLMALAERELDEVMYPQEETSLKPRTAKAVEKKVKKDSVKPMAKPESTEDSINKVLYPNGK